MLLRTSIDIGNVYSGILEGNMVLSFSDFMRYHDEGLGIPILVPADSNILDFDENDVFEIDRELLLKVVFNTENQFYVGFDLAFQSNRFVKKFEPKACLLSEIEFVKSQNRFVMERVAKLREKYATVGSFQTRNIPHFGHEKIIEMMLNHCEHVVINPVVGSKKPGDIKIENLETVFNEIVSKKFAGRISFQPILANMYYAGPREAVHHAIMRKNLGFTNFSVGRDHAGAEGIYPEDEAPSLARKHEKRLGISILTHDGAYFCKDCDEVILKNMCPHGEASLSAVSGSDFRRHIESGTVYDLADLKIQKHLNSVTDGVFEK